MNALPRSSLTLTALEGVPEVRAGDSLAEITAVALTQNGIEPASGDVIIYCQKVVSKSENRYIDLRRVEPSERAIALADVCEKDPRFVEVVLRESTQVLRCVKDVLIVRHRLGFVVANAAIDQSNITDAEHRVLLLPADPDASAHRLRIALRERLAVDVGVLISDSFGRAWRVGVCGTCIGCAGLTPLSDMRGKPDRFGRVLKVTQVAVADELVAAATLVMGEADEGRPIVIASGLAPEFFAAPAAASRLIRPPDQDLFT